MSLNFSDYKTKLTFPKKGDFTVTHYYKNGKNTGTYSLKDLSDDERAQVRTNHAGHTSENVFEEEAYCAAYSAYNNDVQHLTKLFSYDLIAYHGLPRNSFTLKLYDLAYDRGHSGGFSEIASNFEELAELNSFAVSTYSK